MSALEIFVKVLKHIFRKIWHFFNWNIPKTVHLHGIPMIHYKNRIQWGNNIHVNERCFFHAVGWLRIGNNVTFSYGCSVFTTGLNTDDWKNNREHIDRSVIIHDNVWLCANVTICPGVEIASNCIVAAGSVVTESLNDEGYMYGGIPARKIKKL